MSPPFCLALVLCDAVHRDPSTGKFTLLGLYENIFATQFPTSQWITLYFAVTDGLGPVRLAIRIVDAKSFPSGPPPREIDVTKPPEDGSISLCVADADFSSPLVVNEQAVTFLLPIEKEGVYLCELWADSELLMTRRVSVRAIPLPQADL